VASLLERHQQLRCVNKILVVCEPDLDLGGQKQARDAASILEAMDCTFYCLLTDKPTVANCPFVLDVALSNMELLINVSVEQYDV